MFKELRGMALSWQPGLLSIFVDRPVKPRDILIGVEEGRRGSASFSQKRLPCRSFLSTHAELSFLSSKRATTVSTFPMRTSMVRGVRSTRSAPLG